MVTQCSSSKKFLLDEGGGYIIFDGPKNFIYAF